jgi:hypothetical protein
VLLLPFMIAGAAGASLSVDGTPVPGGRIKVSGEGFEPSSRLDMHWDGESAEWLRRARVNREGTFRIALDLPANTPLGDHVLSLVPRLDEESAPDAEASAGAAPSDVASVTVTVIDAPPDPTPTPSPKHTAAPTATPAATATPRPTNAPTPAPTTNPGPTATPTNGPAPTTAPPPGSVNPVTCAGYPEPRVFIESQDWWSPIPDLGGLGHVHLGMCFPVGQTVSGLVRFDVRVIFHGNKGRLTLIKMQDDRSTDHYKFNPNFVPNTGIDTTYWHTFTLDTRKMADGIRSFRWYAQLLHANGNPETARANWPLRVENGTADLNSASLTQIQGSGWYKEAANGADWGYQTAFLTTGIPLAPVRGVWQPGVRFSCNGCPAMSGYMATVDPNFHAGIQGWIVKQGSGGWGGNLAIDTSRLTNGVHKLVLISLAEGADPTKQHGGVLAIPFSVSN